MKNKHNIWVSLALAIIIVCFIGNLFISFLEESLKGEDISALAFGVVYIMVVIFYFTWCGLGMLFSKIINHKQKPLNK